MKDWINLGDCDPAQGAFFVRNCEVTRDGFEADVVVITPDKNQGGSDRVFDVAFGRQFLARREFASAMKALGNTFNAKGDILRDDGDNGKIKRGSKEYLLELAYATQSHCGFEPEGSTLVGVGLPRRYDQDVLLGQPEVLYPVGSSLWAIAHQVCDGFDYTPADTVIEPVEPLDLVDGPYANCPQNIRSMADVMQIKAYADLGADADGQPKVWEHSIRMPDGRRETVLSAHQDFILKLDDDDVAEFEKSGCTVEETSIYPASTRWIGPEQEDLQGVWEDFYVDLRADSEIEASPSELSM